MRVAIKNCCRTPRRRGSASSNIAGWFFIAIYRDTSPTHRPCVTPGTLDTPIVSIVSKFSSANTEIASAIQYVENCLAYRRRKIPSKFSAEIVRVVFCSTTRRCTYLAGANRIKIQENFQSCIFTGGINSVRVNPADYNFTILFYDNVVTYISRRTQVKRKSLIRNRRL